MGAMQTVEALPPYDVVVLGAGYAGLMAALRLGRRKFGLRIALVSASDHFLERVRLQETIVNAVAPRIPSIAALVEGTPITFIAGRVVSLDAAQRRVRLATQAGEQELAFEQAIYALGSTIEVEAVPGVATHAYRLEAGEGPRSAAALRARLYANGARRLRVVVVGGAETAVEAAGEIKTAWPAAEVSMVSRSRCGALKGTRVEGSIRTALTRLGVQLIDHETVAEVRADAVVTAAGRSIPCDICVWSGGLATAPLARAAGITTDPRGRVFVDPNLRSISHPRIRAIGDAARPIATDWRALQALGLRGAGHRRLRGGCGGGRAPRTQAATVRVLDLRPGHRDRAPRRGTLQLSGRPAALLPRHRQDGTPHSQFLRLARLCRAQDGA